MKREGGKPEIITLKYKNSILELEHRNSIYQVRRKELADINLIKCYTASIYFCVCRSGVLFQRCTQTIEHRSNRKKKKDPTATKKGEGM